MDDCHFGYKQKFQKTKKKQWSRELFGKFQKKSSHFKERSFEIAKILGGFAQISRFFFFGNCSI
jgi:hypothetical protein